MIIIKKTILTLALLLTAASGAWADIAIGDVYKFGSQIDFGSAPVWTLTVSGGSDGGGSTISGSFTLGYNGYSNGKHWLVFPTGSGSMSRYIADNNQAEPWGIQVSGGDGSYENPYTFSAIYEAPLIYHSLSDDKWIVTMPAGNVTVEPEYYAQAIFATEGNEALTPTAAEDAIAGTDAPLIVEGTVAKAGQTDDAQGQVMYAVTTTADAAPALTAFSATVPTAEDYDDATTVFVWYYIQGADAPTGTVPSDDNTFSDSDISGTPLQVNVLPNKFTLTFDPAPVEKVDVTVDGQAATPQQNGKLKNVKMGKEVKLKAKTGYKLKKVEVKKKEIVDYTSIIWKPGDIFNIDEAWYRYDNTHNNSNYHATGVDAVIPAWTYSNKWHQWTATEWFIPTDIMIDNEIENETTNLQKLYFGVPSGKTSNDTPTGFKIKSGDGTKANPYKFELVF